MPDIKTRDAVKKTVKVIDKSAVAAERMKNAYIRTKDKAEHSVFAAESSPEEYAADRTLTGTETAAHEAANGFDKAGRKGVKATKENPQQILSLYHFARLIHVEEDFLFTTFGNEYLQYKKKVCRYIGRKR